MRDGSEYVLMAMDNANGLYNNAIWILRDDLREEYERVKNEIQEIQKEDEKREKAMRQLEEMVAFLSENADSETLQTIVSILWNING